MTNIDRLWIFNIGCAICTTHHTARITTITLALIFLIWAMIKESRQKLTANGGK